MTPPIGGARAGYISGQRDAIPDNKVSRETDDNTFTRSFKVGLRFETSQQWPSIQGQLSSNTSSPQSGGPTVAYLQETNGTVIKSVDISTLSAGAVVTFNDVNLSANTSYDMLMDNSGADYTYGQKDDSAYPHTSTDGNLVITDGYLDGGIDTMAPFSAFGYITIGNINLG